MPRLAIAHEFLKELSTLEPSVRDKVHRQIVNFPDLARASQHLEKIARARDPRMRTIRIDNNYRGIVMAPEKGDSHVLVRVLPHDEANRWAETHRFNVNTATGALEIEVVDVRERAEDVLDAGLGDPDAQPVFTGRKDGDFKKFGINPDLVPLLQKITSEAELTALTGYLPPAQQEALTYLATGAEVQEVWEAVVAAEQPAAVDPEDTDAALERPVSRQTFVPVEGAEELREMLARPFGAWRTFLHPKQRRIAERESHRGPMRVTGSAGTGKTVVVVHRARALARRAAPSDRILITTYTRNLAAAIEDLLRDLGGQDLASRVEVLNVDRLAYRVVRDAEGGTQIRLLFDPDHLSRWKEIVLAQPSGFPYTAEFLRQEWEQVVLAQGVSSLDGYLAASRAGRGKRLSRRQRVEVWKAVEAFTNHLAADGLRTPLQLADAAAGFLAARSVRPYRHVLIDEAQDLHPAQWRMLREAVPAEAADNLFIVGDTHQRIYDHRVTLASLGINVRGRRSHKLRISYRTTQEILHWSVGLLRGEHFDDLDGAEDTLLGYRSQLHGATPATQGYPSAPEELDGLVATVKGWLGGGQPAVRPEEIAVAARTRDTARRVYEALDAAGVPATILSRNDRAEETSPGVKVATMHRMKGLEFKCVAVVDTGAVPEPAALTPGEEDPVAHRHDLQRERCLLYVACTRARDALQVTWNGPPSEFLQPLLGRG